VSGISSSGNINFPVVAGGFLPGGVGTGTRAENVQGCSAVAEATVWRIILTRPIPALKAIVLATSEGDAGATPLSAGTNYTLFSETELTLYDTKIAGTLNRAQGISFLILEVPRI
jgi:hypothetical protein